MTDSTPAAPVSTIIAPPIAAPILSAGAASQPPAISPEPADLGKIYTTLQKLDEQQTQMERKLDTIQASLDQHTGKLNLLERGMNEIADALTVMVRATGTTLRNTQAIWARQLSTKRAVYQLSKDRPVTWDEGEVLEIQKTQHTLDPNDPRLAARGIRYEDVTCLGKQYEFTGDEKARPPLLTRLSNAVQAAYTQLFSGPNQNSR